jgi:hypothetical protein
MWDCAEIGLKSSAGMARTVGFAYWLTVVMGECINRGACGIIAHGLSPTRSGDGRSYPHNPRSDEMLARLASELVRIDSNPR